MLPYWLLFTLWAAGAVQAERRRAQDPRLLIFVGATVLTTLMIGLRFEVGGDWHAYLNMYDSIFFVSLPAALEITDPGYAAINWFAAQTGAGVAFVNMVCAALFMGGVGRLAWQQPNPALAVLVAVPYLIIVVAMGYTRQAAAIGIICLAAADASERHLVRVVVLVAIAALFHKTALLILPVMLVPIFRRNKVLGVFGVAIFVVLFIFILRSSSDQLIASYAQSEYDSQGAVIRVAMNVLAAAIFLLIAKRLEMDVFKKSFWTMCAIMAALSPVGFLISSATSGIDRISLYLVPLQMVTYARIPYILSKQKNNRAQLIIVIMIYCFFVEFVWLNYADNVRYWIPYRLAF